MTDSSKQWSGAVLAIFGIAALTFLGYEKVISGDGVGYAIVALAMRAGGLLTHGLGKLSAATVDTKDGGD